MQFTDNVKRFLQLHRQALLMSSAPAAAMDKEQLHPSSTKAGSKPPTDFRPLSGEMEESFARFVEVWGRRVEDERYGVVPTVNKHDKKSRARKAENSAILREEGRDSTEVAYLYGRTTQGVEKIRARAGLDPKTGLRLAPKPLTAPGHAQFLAWAEAQGDIE